MHLFTVRMPEFDDAGVGRMRKLLEEHAGAVPGNGAAGPAVRFESVGKQVIGRATLPAFQLKQHGPDVYKSSAKALAEFIVDEMEASLLKAAIRKRHRANPALDADIVYKYCQSIMNGDETDGLGIRFREADQARRKGKVAQEAEDYLQEHTELHLTGFAQFRLASYRAELGEIVDYAIDEYVLDKQYQEFISLLKYFVQLQETKVPLVHLLHKGGHEFALYNESFQTLEPKPHNDRIVAEMLETEMNIEDMVISSLISVSPKHIMIHTRHPDMGAIHTIQTIFGQRVTICVQCASCSRSLDGLIQP